MLEKLLSMIAGHEAHGTNVRAIHLSRAQYMEVLGETVGNYNWTRGFNSKSPRLKPEPHEPIGTLFGIPIYIREELDPLLVAAQKAALAGGETIGTL